MRGQPPNDASGVVAPDFCASSVYTKIVYMTYVYIWSILGSTIALRWKPVTKCFWHPEHANLNCRLLW